MNLDAIRKKCEWNVEEALIKFPPRSNHYYGEFRYGAEHQHAKMIPIIEGLLRVIEMQNEALNRYEQPWERGELDGQMLVRKIGSNEHFAEVHSIATAYIEKIQAELDKIAGDE